MIDLTALQIAFPELTNIRQLSGNSGQKFVFQGLHLQGEVALKIIKSGLADGGRTEREIAAVMALASPYVPRIHEHGVRPIFGSPQLFIIEEFITGPSYREVLNKRLVQDVYPVVRLVCGLLLACGNLEKARIVHRDIKPDNIIIDGDGKVWLIDFGIARHLDLSSITLDGAYGGIGTLGYAAPEQFQNIKAQINSRTDFFAIGVIAYEALIGGNPYRRGLHTPMAIMKRMEKETLPLLELPQDTSGQFAGFIQFLINRYPSRRPQTVAEALAAFEPIRVHYSL